MNNTGVVRGFCGYTPLQREQLCRDLSISLSDKLLTFCMEHYRNAEKRDPYIDELQMLASLAAALREDCAALLVSELFTNDTFVYDTYRDLLQKRKELVAHPSSPLSLRNMASIAPRYLRRAGKGDGFTACSSSLEYLRDLPTSPTALGVAPAHSPFRLRMCASARSPKGTDTLVLLTPAPEDTVYRHARKCESLLDSEEISSHLRGIFPVGTGGLLRELLEITDGLCIDLCAFSPLDPEPTATALTECFEGSRILRIGTEELTPLLSKIAEHGMCAFPFAKITGDKRYTFVRKSGNGFSIQTNFLCSLIEKAEISVKLPNESEAHPDTVCHRPTNVDACAYLSHTSAQREAVSVGKITACAVGAVAKRAFFKTALLASVIPAVIMALCGKERTEYTFTSAFEFPTDLTDPYTAGKCVSMLLGAYRAQAELSIAAHRTAIRTAEISSPSVSVFAHGEAHPFSSLLTKENSTVYCLAVPFDTQGLPDFSALRTVLGELSALARDGQIASARVLQNESIAQGLLAMQGAFGARLSVEAPDTDKPLPLAVLIESVSALPYRPVAKTTLQEPIPSASPASLPLCGALLWSGVPEITVLAQDYDSDAAALCGILSKKGARVHSIFSDKENALPLSRAILSSQLLILCRGTSMGEDARVLAAVRFLKESGGHVLSMLDAVSANALCLKNGISEELLESFFSNP